MMTKRYFTLFFVCISLLLHFLILFCCPVYIGATASPSIYIWNNLVAKKDLFFEKKPVNYPPKVFAAANNLMKEYFFSSLPTTIDFTRSYRDYADILPYAKIDQFPQEFAAQKRNDHIYLWEREASLPQGEENTVPYQIYVSKYGKIVFLYPEKLLFDSRESLNFQDYLRESALFLEDKFFWTKLEVVVK